MQNVSATSSLSLTGKRWILPEELRPQNPAHLLARLFAERGINDDACRIPSPGCYPDMLRATERIACAVAHRQRIGIFGDYDCDGVTAAAQLVRYFRRRGLEPFVRLPHRVHDGYGLNARIAQECANRDLSLLITCDTGITAIEPIAMLAESGIDVIVTDHHHLHEELPPAYALLHPAIGNHPLPHPSGAGVVFALISALEGEAWDGMEEDAALAMFGTVGDLVELRGGNRALTRLGLASLRDATGPVAALRDRCRRGDTPLTSTDIAFRIAPRINAAGRMDSPSIALQALLSGGSAIETLEQLNERRQEQTRTLLDTVLQEYGDAPLPPLLMHIDNAFPHGIVGLLAGKLTETYGRPSLVAHSDGAVCTASLRSTDCYNVAEGLDRCSDLLVSYGGHAQAAGCSFTAENATALQRRLAEDIRSRTDERRLTPALRIDALLDAADVTERFCRQLQDLAPYGQGNPEPLFLLRGVSLQNARACGSDRSHLQARISGVKSIGFGLAHLASATERFDVVARVDISTWNGTTEPQFVLQDLAVATERRLAG